MKSVLTDITKKDILLDPFPHLNITNALDEATHQRILRELPTIDQIENILRVNDCPDSCYWLYIDRLRRLDPVPETIIEFLEAHSSDEFVNSVYNLFEEHIKNMLPLFRKKDISPTAAMCINPRTKSNMNNLIRGPHLDQPHDMFVFLYYLKPPQMQIEGGDLELYKYKTRFKGFDRSQFRDPRIIPEKDIIKVKTIPYESNRFVLILDGIHSVHGVSPVKYCNTYRIRLDGGALYKKSEGEPNYYYTDYLTLPERMRDFVGRKRQGLRRRICKKYVKTKDAI